MGGEGETAVLPHTSRPVTRFNERIPMKTPIWKILAVLAVGLPLLAVGITRLLKIARTPHLSSAICQPSDLGERYRLSDGPTRMARPQLTETVVESRTVVLIDNQLSYTMLDCQIYRFENAAAANRAFAETCRSPVEVIFDIGDEACVFAGTAPRNLAFRRGAYLVLMRGDVGFFPAQAVDERLR